MRFCKIYASFFGAAFLSFAAFGAEQPITILVDATDAPRNILHAQLHIPALPGTNTVVYPKWIPGEHGPTGPVTDLTGIEMSANGHSLRWRRDDVDMFAFHVDVPNTAKSLDITLDFLLPPSGGFSSGASSTPNLLDLNWNQVLLYPQNKLPKDIHFTPSLKLPAGWGFGTALIPEKGKENPVKFETVTLETLIDSPVIAGAHFRSVDLAPKIKPAHHLDLVADTSDALAITPEEIAHFSHLVTETGALFGARHYHAYTFLLTLSEHVAHFGLEHHESSDNREGEKYLTDDDELMRGAYLLCHEMVHSWNGKYRRPAGLATPNYQEPMKGELLWVYEGLTDYLGILLAARSGLWNQQNFRDYLALNAANLDHEPGRTWRSIEDTAVSAQLLYEARQEGDLWRRGTDFYQEGDLIWLDADVLIRQLTRGKKSLNDFCRTFYGGKNGGPKVVPYTRLDVSAALNEIAPHDWNDFFQKRVYNISPHAPLGGIENSGWRVVYTNILSGFQKARESARKVTDMRLSLGTMIKHEGGDIIDVAPGSPAEKAGLAAAMKLVAVNGRKFTPEILRAAVAAASTNHIPIELLMEDEDLYTTHRLEYYGGERYAQLQRDPAKPDLLTEILKPLTPNPAVQK